MALFKQVMGTILLIGFIGFMAYKLKHNVADMGNDSVLFMAFVFLVVLIIIMIIRKIVLH